MQRPEWFVLVLNMVEQHTRDGNLAGGKNTQLPLGLTVIAAGLFRVLWQRGTEIVDAADVA